MLPADSGKNNPEGIIIFGTKKNLDLLYDSDCIYFDGTFKLSPDLFNNFFTLHGFFEGLQFPLVENLLPGKPRTLYYTSSSFPVA